MSETAERILTKAGLEKDPIGEHLIAEEPQGYVSCYLDGIIEGCIKWTIPNSVRGSVMLYDTQYPKLVSGYLADKDFPNAARVLVYAKRNHDKMKAEVEAI